MEQKHVDFDDYAEDYREIHTRNVQAVSGTDSSYFGEYKIKIISQEENDKRKIRILDLGCGDGLNALFFEKCFDGMEYYGIDVSEESIKQAEKYSSSNIHFSVYDGSNIPFEENYFDIILLACVLHHVPHEQHFALLSECKRVLKKDGHLYIFEHNPINPVTRKIVKDCPFDADAVLVSSRRLKKMLSVIGYNKIAISYTIFFPRKSFFNTLLWMENWLKWLPLGGQYYIRSEK